MFSRDRLWNVLQTLGGIALFIALMPSFSLTTGVPNNLNQAMIKHIQDHNEDMPFKQEFSFGLPNSLLFYHYKVKTLEMDGDNFTVNTTTIRKVGWRSWSAFALVLSVSIFVIASRFKPKATVATKTSDPSTPSQ